MDELIVFQVITFFIFGLLFGSFFNVLILRLPNNKSIAWPGSQCPKCSRSLPFYENIPVISYLFLGGKCAGCKGKISIQYPIIELFTAIFFIVLWYLIIYPHHIENVSIWDYCFHIMQFASLAILIPVTIIDISHYIIPDSITLGGLVIGILISFFPGTITPQQSLYGILAGGGSLLLMGYFGEYVLRKKDSMGGGDIKLMAFIGSIWGWKIALLSIAFGAFAGSIVGIPLIIFKILKKDQHIPFGPYLSAGIFIASFWGEKLYNGYMSFLEKIYF